MPPTSRSNPAAPNPAAPSNAAPNLTASHIIRTHAYARAGLIGNPSDGYFGKTIALIVRNYSATVYCYETPRVQLIPRRRDAMAFDSIDHLAEDVRINGYYGIVRLLKAAVKRFRDHCQSRGIELPARNFTIEADTDIPVRVGMAGSSAIITATLRALMAFYGVDIPKPILPQVILDVELVELKIGAGLQDRVAQVYEGCVFMDFDRATIERDGHGRYESLEPANLPPVFVAFHNHLAEGTEVTHNDLRERWNRGDKDVHEAVARFADLAQQARDLIAHGRATHESLGPLLNANFDLRAELIRISEGNQRLVKTARDLGCSCKFAGSGGAVVGSYDGDPARLERLRQAYTDIGATLIEPIMQPIDR